MLANPPVVPIRAVPQGLAPVAKPQGPAPVAKDAAVRTYLEPLKQHLEGTGASEIWINEPGELIIEVNGNCEYIKDPSLTFHHLESFAIAIAGLSAQGQQVNKERPILSSTLPDGERVQIVLPPCVEPGKPSFSIRIPNDAIIPLETYKEKGTFERYLWAHPKGQRDELLNLLDREDQELAAPLFDRQLDSFINLAIKARKNIAVVGDTGSGKTTLMKSMCQSIPGEERLITIEDVRELHLPQHRNKVHLLYSKGGQGVAKITPGDLIASCMRMTPSRALLAELRGMEAWDFLKLLTTGHSGSITSYHAESCALAFQRFMFMVKEHPEASTLTRDELTHLITLTLDVIIHVERKIIRDENYKPIRVERYVKEVFFDPWAKNKAKYGDREVIHAG